MLARQRKGASVEGTAIISRVAPAPFFHGVMGKVAISKKNDHGLLGGIQRVDGFCYKRVATCLQIIYNRAHKSIIERVCGFVNACIYMSSHLRIILSQ